MTLKSQLIEKLNKDIIFCNKCPLRKNCIQPIPGEGDLDCSVMIIGESPGREEDQKNRPFVGRSGKLLNASITPPIKGGACNYRQDDDATIG